jgi:hypothetical protein
MSPISPSPNYTYIESFLQDLNLTSDLLAHEHHNFYVITTRFEKHKDIFDTDTVNTFKQKTLDYSFRLISPYLTSKDNIEKISFQYKDSLKNLILYILLNDHEDKNYTKTIFSSILDNPNLDNLLHHVDEFMKYISELDKKNLTQIFGDIKKTNCDTLENFLFSYSLLKLKDTEQTFFEVLGYDEDKHINKTITKGMDELAKIFMYSQIHPFNNTAFNRIFKKLFILDSEDLIQSTSQIHKFPHPQLDVDFISNVKHLSITKQFNFFKQIFSSYSNFGSFKLIKNNEHKFMEIFTYIKQNNLYLYNENTQDFYTLKEFKQYKKETEKELRFKGLEGLKDKSHKAAWFQWQVFFYQGLTTLDNVADALYTVIKDQEIKTNFKEKILPFLQYFDLYPTEFPLFQKSLQKLIYEQVEIRPGTYQLHFKNNLLQTSMYVEEYHMKKMLSLQEKNPPIKKSKSLKF